MTHTTIIGRVARPTARGAAARDNDTLTMPHGGTAQSPPLDVTWVRAQFPAPRRRMGVHGQRRRVANPGAGRRPHRDYLLTTNVQHGASYAVSQAAAARVQEAQVRIAELLNAERPEEDRHGPDHDALLQLLARAMAGQLAPGDEVVVTRADHESNIGPWVGCSRTA